MNNHPVSTQSQRGAIARLLWWTFCLPRRRPLLFVFSILFTVFMITPIVIATYFLYPRISASS